MHLCTECAPSSWAIVTSLKSLYSLSPPIEVITITIVQNLMNSRDSDESGALDRPGESGHFDDTGDTCEFGDSVVW